MTGRKSLGRNCNVFLFTLIFYAIIEIRTFLNIFTNIMFSNSGLWPQFYSRGDRGSSCVYNLPKFSLLVWREPGLENKSLTPKPGLFPPLCSLFKLYYFFSSRPTTPAYKEDPTYGDYAKNTREIELNLNVDLFTILSEQAFKRSGKQSRHTGREVDVGPECHIVLPSPLPSLKGKDFNMTLNYFCTSRTKNLKQVLPTHLRDG